MTQNRSSAVMQQRVEAPDSLDYFPTPPWATRALCDLLQRGGAQLGQLDCWEPCCGEGHMVRPLAEYFADVHATDVHDYSEVFPDQFDVMDFAMDWTASDTPQTDWVITNPPFRLAPEIIHNARQVARHGVAMLVRTSFLEGATRYDTLFAQHPPTSIHQFCERVPMFKGKVRQTGAKFWDATMNGGSGGMRSASTATSYCWLIWRRAGGGAAPSFHWIPPCRTQFERAGDYPTYSDDQPPAGTLI